VKTTSYPADKPIPPALLERCLHVVHPWSGASGEERARARDILREAERRRLNARFGRSALHNERIIEEDPL
jgi:hypothetical protein